MIPKIVSELRAAHQAVPFRPFQVQMTNGRRFDVPHPDFLQMLPKGTVGVIYSEDTEWSSFTSSEVSMISFNSETQDIESF